MPSTQSTQDNDTMRYHPMIAVVGMAGLFPGASNLQAYWQNVISKSPATREAPVHRWIAAADEMVSSTLTPDKALHDRCCTVDRIEVDPTGLSLPPSLIAELDPLYHMVLEVGRKSVSEPVPIKLNRQRTGVILAAIALPTDTSSAITRELFRAFFEKKILGSFDYRIPTPNKAKAATVTALPAALLARALGLGGGTYTLDAACASSIYAVKLACDELIARRADAMLAGGVSRPDCLYTQVGFSQLKALSPSGRCAPFDRSADGLVVGEGAGVLVLKRLEDACADNDRIYGVIHGIGLSNDMRGNLLAPETRGQLRAMQSAYRAAGWHPSDIDLIECHGAGTPVGDTTELNSLCRLWGDSGWTPGQCAIGSVKSMIGHLLTAAGAAGIIKTLLALKEKTLPPSLNFEQPPQNSPLPGSPFRVQTDPVPWPEHRGRRRRAAVSAFGFGGINGHLLLEEWPSEDHPEAEPPPTAVTITGDHKAHMSPPAILPSPAIAVVGMAVTFGPVSSLRQFQDIVFNGRSIITDRPEGRWKGLSSLLEPSPALPQKGGFISNLRIGVDEFRIPPMEIPDILPQHLLVLQVAAGAMADAGLSESIDRSRMGAIIGLDFDFEATAYHFRWSLAAFVRKWCQQHFSGMDQKAIDNWLSSLKNTVSPPLSASRTLGALGGIVASRIAREFKFGSHSFGVSAGAASGNRALEIGVRSLQRKETDAVLVGAVDLAGDLRHILTGNESGAFSSQGTVHPFDPNADGTLPGEGAAALVLKRHDQAVSDGNRIYALIRGIGNSSGDTNDGAIGAETISRALREALKEADASPIDIDYVETTASGMPHGDLTISQALKIVFSETQATHAVGSSVANLGHTGAAAGLAAVVKTALCLYHRILPPLAGYRSVTKNKDDGHGDEVNFPTFPQYWFRNRTDGPRQACIGITTGDGNVAAAVLQEAPDQGALLERAPAIAIEEKRYPLGPPPLGLFVVQGQNPRSLLSTVENLRRYAENQSAGHLPIEISARRWLQQHPLDPAQPLAAVLLAPEPASLTALTDEARQAIESETSQSFNDGDGVCYQTMPLGGGDLAFVYPGAGNHYPGMERGIALHWPEVMNLLNDNTSHLKSLFRPDRMNAGKYNRESDIMEFPENRAITGTLDTLFRPVAYGCMTTTLLQCLNVNPRAVIGYSLGEVTGLIAMQVWPDRDAVFERMRGTDLFHNQLSGPCLAARQAWGLNPEEEFSWRTAVVNRSAAAVRAALKGLPAVRLLIVNSPEECVVGGKREQVGTLIRRLDCQAIDLEGVVAVHCDALTPVAHQYRALHDFPTVSPQGIRFYSCYNGRAYEPTTDSTADSILSQALHGFEYPPVIDQAYADGVRVFLELGPGASCSRMIGRILGNRPHRAIALDTPGTDGIQSIMKGIGTLIAERVSLGLDWLYPPCDESPPSSVSNSIRQDRRGMVEIGVGGPPLSPSGPSPSIGARDSAPLRAAEKKPSAVSDPQPARLPNGLLSGQRDDSQRLAPGAANGPAPHASLLDEFNRTVSATAAAHNQFLDFSTNLSRSVEEAVAYHTQLADALSRSGTARETYRPQSAGRSPGHVGFGPVAFDRPQCLEFATGKVAKVLGPEFSPVDTYATRVRLPAEPLMLVDRIVSVDGVKGSLTCGRLVTEHDVLPDAWYLDGGRAPVCIAVEAGQADLFLCSYLGIDLAVKGQRVYRLLDASVVFHRDLPQPGDVIRYEITIQKFIRQGETYLFFFNFEGTIDNQPLISMTDGCAGFFTEEEIQDSGGIIPTAEDRETRVGRRDPQWTEIVPQALESYTDDQLDALRAGDLAACFGPDYNGITLAPSLWLPGGRMKLLDRIPQIDPRGGRYGLGSIRAEADIHPDDWFLTCHFVDDMTMPGTLMYECCAHALRVFLLRMGWVSDRPDVHCDAIPGIKSVLRCRGPVTPQTRQVIYEVELKEIGYGPEPYALADAHMYADGRYIVRFTDMAIRLSGMNRDLIEAVWISRQRTPSGILEKEQTPEPVLFDRRQILAFAAGRPSEAFGDRYAAFDTDRFIARLPSPPYSFIDRVVKAEPEPWKLTPGGWVDAEFDVQPDAWYFQANRSDRMPYCVLLEIALQACGWLAAYAGSALVSAKDLRFRNLDGQATLHQDVPAVSQTLTIRCRMNKVSRVGDVIIESFEFRVLCKDQRIYDGTTVFGFFTPESLADQKGINIDDNLPAVRRPDVSNDTDHGISLPDEPPLTPFDSGTSAPAAGLSMPAKALRMIDRIDIYQPFGGSKGLGYWRATKKIDPAEWFFKAHFYQDPVCPGSLGIESFLQLLKYDAIQRWGHLSAGHRFEHSCRVPHSWQYRGQIVPQNQVVEVEAVITSVTDEPAPEIRADGILTVDGLAIYHMKDYGLRIVPA